LPDRHAMIPHTKALIFFLVASQAPQVNGHSSLKEAAMQGCQKMPSFLSALKCEEGQVCTYKETRFGETFTAEKSGAFLKVTTNALNIYMSGDTILAASPCDGKTLKVDILTPAVFEGHKLTCTDEALRDVAADNDFNLQPSGDNSVDLVDVLSDGTELRDHVERSSSAPGNGFSLPSDAHATVVSRRELFERLSSDCSSLALVDSLDRAVSKKGGIGAIFGGLAFYAMGAAACAFGGPFGCAAAIGLFKVGTYAVVNGIVMEVKAR